MAAFIKISDNYTRSEKRKAYEDFWKKTGMPIVLRVVMNSFIKGNHKITFDPTKDQVRERVDICKRIVNTMRQDFKWSKWRIRDTLPTALSAELSGLILNLERMGRRSSW